VKVKILLLIQILFFSMPSLYAEDNYDKIVSDFLDTTKPPEKELKLTYLMLFRFLNANWNLFYQVSQKDPHRLVPCKNCDVRHILRHENSIIWDKFYSYGKDAQRAIAPATENPTQFFSMLGCSYSMGQGLNNNETIASNFSKLRTDYAPYIFADMGIGPHSVLKVMEEDEFKDSIKQQNGVFVYLFSEDIHLARANGFMHELQWVYKSPYYEWNGDDLVTKGSFEEMRPLTNKFYRSVQSIFNMIGVRNNFPMVTKGHREKLCRIVEKMKKVSEEKFPHSKFLVYQYPLSSGASDYMRDCFKRKNITYIENSERLVDLTKIKELIYENDGHPNPIGAKYIAEEISRNIEQYLN
jgi:hypothetical protein